MASSGVQISLSAETLFHIGPIPVTNTLLASALIVLFLVSAAVKVKSSGYNLKNNFYNFVEMLMEGFFGIIEKVLDSRKVARQTFAILVTFFIFIIINNWFGIFPGVGASLELHKKSPQSAEESVKDDAAHAVTNVIAGSARDGGDGKGNNQPVIAVNGAKEEKAHSAGEEGEPVHLLRAANSDLNMTLAIALVSVIFIQITVIRNLGLKNYLKKFFNFSGPIMFFVGILEIISEFIKILSFAFRLFGNIFAGEVLITVIYFLLLFLLPIPFMGMELFFGFIQALIFTMLTLVFIKASLAHEEH